MKKKKIIYVACGCVLATLIALLLLFVFSGDINTLNKNVDVTGVWKVVTHVKDGSATLLENEFMVFKDGHASVYRNGNKEVYASSNFTIDSSMLMELSDISRKYTVEYRSNNLLRLYENSNMYMCLIRYPNQDMGDMEIDTSIVEGKWNVVYRDSDKTYAGEYLVFQNGIMHDYNGNDESPNLTINYSWSENKILMPSINKKMILYVISNSEIVFIETDTGYIWELKKD